MPAFEPEPSRASTSASAPIAAGGCTARSCSEGVVAVRTGEQAETQQQARRAEARHDQVDKAGAHILGHAMVRHHQRPGSKRHELPRQQKGEGVIGQHHARHGGKERRIKRQHPPGRSFVLPVADRKQARAYRTEVDHDQKESRERIQSEVRTEPWNAER